MRLTVAGNKTYVATGGKPFDAALPAVVFLHGAGFDHSSWALHSRWFAHNGFSVLAPDLPGHGLSQGTPLASVGAMADWSIALIEAAGAIAARLIGHSMGSFIALEAAARHPDKVTGLGLIATATAMPVSDKLLAAAKANDPAAIDMMTIWGHGTRATLGGSLAPGLWMLGGGVRVLETAKPGLLHTDLAASGEYKNAPAAAATINVPTTLVLGERDVMTPTKGGRALAAAIPNAKTVVIPGAGHMLMTERPDEVLAALRL